MGRITRLVSPDHFGLLLLLLLGTFFSAPLLGSGRYAGVVSGVLATAVLGVALVASGIERGWVTAMVAIGGVVVVASLTDAAQGGAPAAWVSGLVTALIAATPVLVFRRIMGHERVTPSTVAGALCAYLLIGLTFAGAYRTISAVDPDAFTEVLDSSSVYFSFVTLTTLGYGDISPVGELTRSLTALEAVLGQVVLVTLVARFVGILGEVRPRLVRRPSGGDDAAPPAPS